MAGQHDEVRAVPSIASRDGDILPVDAPMSDPSPRLARDGNRWPLALPARIYRDYRSGCAGDAETEATRPRRKGNAGGTVNGRSCRPGDSWARHPSDRGV